MNVYKNLMAGVLVVSISIHSVTLSHVPSISENRFSQLFDPVFWTQQNYRNTKIGVSCAAVIAVCGGLWYWLLDKRSPEQVYQDAYDCYEQVFKAHNHHATMVEEAYHITAKNKYISIQGVHEDLLETFALMNLSAGWSWYDTIVDSAMSQLSKHIKAVRECMTLLKDDAQDNNLYRKMRIVVIDAEQLHVRLIYLRDWYRHNRSYFALHSVEQRVLNTYSQEERRNKHSMQALQPYIEALRATYTYPYTGYMERLEGILRMLQHKLESASYASTTALVRRVRLLYADLQAIKHTLNTSMLYNNMVQKERELKQLQEELERLEGERKQVEKKRIELERERIKAEQERKRLTEERLQAEHMRQQQERQRLAQEQARQQQEAQQQQQYQTEYVPTPAWMPQPSAPSMTQEEYAHYMKEHNIVMPEPSAPPFDEEDGAY